MTAIKEMNEMEQAGRNTAQAVSHRPPAKFLLCPRCGRKTRTLVREDTELIRFPLFCPKCGYECVVGFKKGIIEMMEAPDASEVF